MNKAFNNINEIPVRTWSWLNVNDASLRRAVPRIGEYGKNPLREGAPPGVDITDIRRSPLPAGGYGSAPGEGRALTEFIENNRNSGFFIRINAGEAVEKPLILSYNLDDAAPVLVDDTFILAEKGSKATVVIRYASSGGVEGFHSGLTRVHVEKNAEIRLIKVQELSDGDSHVDRVGVSVEGGGKAGVILTELGSGQAITGCDIALRGENSGAELDSVYFGDGERELDLNYRITHLEKGTVGSINSRGVLTDASKKVFRGTLDFVSGAAGSKGREEEYTVLLSPDVINISTPLLLCGEEDVEGAHAASTGKLDESKLFYLMTRGLSENEAKKIIVEASFAPVIEKIPIKALREEIFAQVRGRLSHV